MNRKKSASSLGFPSLVLLAIAMVIVSASGIGYVVMKNKQVTLRSEIAEVQKRMEEHDVAITLHKADIDDILGYYQLREQLAQQKSKLTEIKYVEVYEAPNKKAATSGSVAQK